MELLQRRTFHRRIQKTNTGRHESQMQLLYILASFRPEKECWLTESFRFNTEGALGRPLVDQQRPL